MERQEEYKRKTVSPEEAVQVIKSGDRVVFAAPEPLTLGLALAARRGELKDVKVLVYGPSRDFGWYDPGWEDSFQISIGYVLPIARQMMEERRGDYLVPSLFAYPVVESMEKADVYMVQLSPPDEHGFCSFGNSLWDKKKRVKEAKIVMAEVNENFIRTYGDNFIHISEIDYFVEHTPTGRIPGATDILGRKTSGPGEVEKKIADYIGTLINDGDVLEIGVGGTAEWIVPLGALDNRRDLGWFSENTVRGIATLVRNGVINGSRKTIHRGKAVGTAVGGGTKEEMDFINMNPQFEVYGSDYILNPGVIAQNDNQVAINSAISVDLTGQIASESAGSTMVSGTGGQLAFAIGANLSRGGRNITVFRSTARGDKVSRIVPMLEPGSIVTVPRTLADLIVTEYGIASLKGKTQRERALELIAIAHPDFRAELKNEANKLF